MKRNLLTCLLSFFLFASVCGQTADTLRGIISDESGMPLPFVNVGVPGCNGTVTDLDGHFALKINDCKASDTLRISMIGYKSAEFIMGNVSTPMSVTMLASQYELQEVKVKSAKMKERRRGNMTESDHMIAGFKTNDLGSEIVMRVPVKHDAWVKKFKFYLARSVFDTLFFRLNVYNIKDGKPAENILSKPIYVTTTSKHGSVAVDLEKYNIVVDGDFAIGLEWVRDLKKDDLPKGLLFSCAIANEKCFYRKASQQEWQSISIFGVGFQVIIAE